MVVSAGGNTSDTNCGGVDGDGGGMADDILVDRGYLKQVLDHIILAAVDATIKHGKLTTDPVRACSILIRECGEAVNEALLMTRPPHSEPATVRMMEVSEARTNLYNELAQVAATAMLMMTSLNEQEEGQ